MAKFKRRVEEAAVAKLSSVKRSKLVNEPKYAEYLTTELRCMGMKLSLR